MTYHSPKEHKKYWAERDIDWNKHYTATHDHPHRHKLSQVLRGLDKWRSVFEVGCASGPNLIRIAADFPRADVGGVDVNPGAIETAKQIFHAGKRHAYFKVSDGENLLLSDETTDVVLSDMTLIYVGSRKIKKHLEEMKRVTRRYIVIIEGHSTNPFVRLFYKWRTGYNLHNYPQLLRRLGFYDIVMHKISPSEWPGGGMQEKYGYIITARKQ